jgi:hypothetical protein
MSSARTEAGFTAGNTAQRIYMSHHMKGLPARSELDTSSGAGVAAGVAVAPFRTLLANDTGNRMEIMQPPDFATKDAMPSA